MRDQAKNIFYHQSSCPESPYPESSCPGFYHMPMAADGGLCRIKLEFGQISLKQFKQLSTIAETEGNGIIELTSRSNIQLRGILPNKQQTVIAKLTQLGLAPLTPQGDHVRNIMINPTAGFDCQGDPDILNFAQQLSQFLQKSPKYQSLSPKFSFYIDGGETCKILYHKSDLSLSLTEDKQDFRFDIACSARDTGFHKPLIAVARAQAMNAIIMLLDMLLDARKKNPSIKRMKQFTSCFPIEFIFNNLQKTIPTIRFPSPVRCSPNVNIPDLGIHKTMFDKRYYLGIRPPLGRLNPLMIRQLFDQTRTVSIYDTIRITPWQGLIFPDCTDKAAKQLKSWCQSMHWVTDKKNAYAHILCCSGKPHCYSAMADVQKDAHHLAQFLSSKGTFPIHLTACAKSCAGGEEKMIKLLAQAPNSYDIYYKEGTHPLNPESLIKSRATINEIKKFLSKLLHNKNNT